MEKDNYQKSVLEYEDVKRAVEYARETAAKAFFEKGMEQGIEKGREEGREEALLQTARKLLEKGIPADDVSEITGLNMDRVRALLDY